MKIRIHLRNSKEIVIPTSASTMEGFMEEFASITSGTFGERAKYMSKCGDFIDFYGSFIRYSDIVMFEEVCVET